MIERIQLTVLVGPVVVAPVPRAVLDLLQTVKVVESAGKDSESGFELVFAFQAGSPLETLFLIASGQTPLLRTILVATINGVPQVLMDGVITRCEVEPPSAGGSSTLRVLGKDLSKLMSLQDLGGLPYPAMPIEARVALIVAKYAAFGIVPLIVPSLFSEVPVPIEKIPAQEGTDLEYIQKLAGEVGYVFYVSSGPVPGANVAYFGPAIKVGVPQRALNVDMDAETNVESLSFRFETAETSLPIVLIQNRATRVPIPIPIPRLNPLQPPLGLVPAPITHASVLRDTAKLSPMAAISKGLAEASRSQDAVSGTGSLDVLRYGRLLRSRQLVGVRGAGTAFDGLYFVEQVTSEIERGELKQTFELSRNGIVSTVPAVPV